MKVILQSSTVFMEIGELDTLSGDFFVYKKECPSVETDGVYDFIDNDFAAIFFADGQVQVRLAEFSTAATERVSARVIRNHGVNELVISRDGEDVFSYRYTAPEWNSRDPTPFVDKEDEDFCLFISNIINSPERKALFDPANR